jgi:hypothetical protein
MTEAEVQNEESMKLLREMKSAYKKTFATANGKVVLDNLRKCLPELNVKPTESANMVYYNIGRRSVMLMIESILKEN